MNTARSKWVLYVAALLALGFFGACSGEDESDEGSGIDIFEDSGVGSFLDLGNVSDGAPADDAGGNEAGPVEDAFVEDAEVADARPGREDAAGFRCFRDFECGDDNPCTDDVCVDGRCQNPFNEAPCPDDDFCNGVEACSDGECVAGDLPCPSAEDCDEESDICTACEIDAHCPEPDVRSSTLCAYPSTCAEEGTNEETVSTYACVDGACESSDATRPGVCSRDSDGFPCGGGVECENGICPRPPLLRVVASGYTNFNARMTASCVGGNQACTVEGNRDRNNRGSLSLSCEITCPAGATVDICCSNGSVPCGGSRISPRNGVHIAAMTTMGFADQNCDPEFAGGNEFQCSALMAEMDAVVDCVFAN